MSNTSASITRYDDALPTDSDSYRLAKAEARVGSEELLKAMLLYGLRHRTGILSFTLADVQAAADRRTA
jgi:hypothetical protein